MEIKNHRLVGVDFVDTPKNKVAFAQGLPDTLLIHYTEAGTPDSAIRTLSDPQIKASAHVVIARDGTVTQLVPFNIQAWHAGASQFGERTGYNQYSIGIELDNAGLLEKRGEKYYAWFGREYPAEEVMPAVHRNQSQLAYWHTYTDRQIEVCETLCRSLIQAYGIQYILGHEEVSPGRKIDPGPAFPLDKFRERLLAGDRDQEGSEKGTMREAIVTASKLNIREQASTSADLVAKPLEKGQKVKILAAKDGWYKVSTEVIGWVSGRYLEGK